MPRQRASDDIKAAALADLSAGEQPAIVARRYGLNRDVVKMWKQRNVTALVTETDATAVTAVLPIRYPTIEDHQQRITTLIYELLAAKLEASKRLAEHTHADWLNRQSAEGLAELGEFLDRTSAGMLTLLARPGRSATDDDTAILDVAE